MSSLCESIHSSYIGEQTQLICIIKYTCQVLKVSIIIHFCGKQLNLCMFLYQRVFLHVVLVMFECQC